MVWDKEVRTSLIVAYTVAGLEQAVVVSKDEIPFVEAAGLKPVEDFRGKFTGKSDIQIYHMGIRQVLGSMQPGVYHLAGRGTGHDDETGVLPTGGSSSMSSSTISPHARPTPPSTRFRGGSSLK